MLGDSAYNRSPGVRSGCHGLSHKMSLAVPGACGAVTLCCSSEEQVPLIFLAWLCGIFTQGEDRQESACLNSHKSVPRRNSWASCSCGQGSCPEQCCGDSQMALGTAAGAHARLWVTGEALASCICRLGAVRLCFQHCGGEECEVDFMPSLC